MNTFKFFALLTICALVLAVGISYHVMASCADNLGKDDGLINELRAGAPWIKFWWMFDGPITNTGGFAAACAVDWLDEGTGGKITDVSATTQAGFNLTFNTEVGVDNKNGGPFNWTTLEIDPANTFNMSDAYGLPDQTNISTYAMLVIKADKDLDATIATAHDDFANIWLNGEHIYSNSVWTGNVNEVDYEQEVKLHKGGNILLFRCDESGGDDHFNLHFDDETNDNITVFPDRVDDAKFQRDSASALAVNPQGKLGATWGYIKQRESSVK